jgi:hypothetical protein
MQRRTQARLGNGLLAAGVFVLGGCPLDTRVLLREHGAGSQAGTAGIAGQVGAAGTSGGDAASGGTTAHAGSGANDAGFDANSMRDDGSSGGDASDADATQDGDSGSAGSLGSGGSAGSGSSTGSGGGGAAGCSSAEVVDDDCGPNLVQNPRFDESVNGWLPEGALHQQWDPRDAAGEAGSGALSIINANAVASNGPGLTMIGSGQCLTVEGRSDYAVGVRLFIPGRQGEGHAGVNVWAFANPDCTGTFLGASTPVFASAVDTWQVASSEIETSPATRSLFVRLVAIKPFSLAAFEVLFDDVALRSR